MGLKPDHWIRMMALEHGMIEPFVDRQAGTGRNVAGWVLDRTKSQALL
jgi:dCTP deaminase